MREKYKALKTLIHKKLSQKLIELNNLSIEEIKENSHIHNIELVEGYHLYTEFDFAPEEEIRFLKVELIKDGWDMLANYVLTERFEILVVVSRIIKDLKDDIKHLKIESVQQDLRKNIPAAEDTRILRLVNYSAGKTEKLTRKDFESRYAMLDDEELSRAWDYLIYVDDFDMYLLDISVDKEVALEFEERVWNRFFKKVEERVWNRFFKKVDNLNYRELSETEGIIKKELRHFLNSKEEKTEESKHILAADLVIYVWGETDPSDGTKFINIQVTTKAREVLEALTLDSLDEAEEVANRIDRHLRKDDKYKEVGPEVKLISKEFLNSLKESKKHLPDDIVANSVHNDEFAYRLLSRFISDIRYFNGAGDRYAKYLWAVNDVEQHIINTLYLYDKLVEKNGPIEWITKEDLDNMILQMKTTEIKESKTLEESTEDLEKRLKELEDQLEKLWEELDFLEGISDRADVKDLIEDTMYWINWHQVEIAWVKGKESELKAKRFKD